MKRLLSDVLGDGYSIELSQKRVYRVFSNEDWKQGGRIHAASCWRSEADSPHRLGTK